jgi:ribonuclease III
MGSCSAVSMTQPNTSALEEALGHSFCQPGLLERALTHSSYARELESPAGASAVGDNEQLEFLGDSVLGLVTSQELLSRFPHFREGQLSKLRAHLVSEKHLVRVARELDLGQYLRLGRGEEKSGGRHKTAMLADCLEAVLGAMYLDSGLEQVRRVVLRHIVDPELAALAQAGKTMPQTDFKSALQEKLQAAGQPQPSYVLVEERGPDHRKTFTVEARLQPFGNGGKSEFVGRAEGSTKKNAEQEAARQLLEYLEAPGGGGLRA